MTGAIVDTVEDAVKALPNVIALDRRGVRQRFEERFTATRMAKDYLQVYRSLLELGRSSLPERAAAMPMQLEKEMN